MRDTRYKMRDARCEIPNSVPRIAPKALPLPLPSCILHPVSRIAPKALLCILFLVAPAYARRPSPKPLPSLVRKTDIMILEGAIPRGWTAPSGWALAYRSDKHHNGEITPGIRSGRFGVLSGGQLCTTWRALAPLTAAAYVEGNTTIYDHHVSNVLTAPFEIKKPYVTFLLSGGNAPGVACVNLLVDGKVVRTATGRNDDMLEWVAFDVRALKGKKARIQVLDTSTAAFGYVTVDCVCQSPDTKGAVRVIATPPAVKTVSHVETLAGKRSGRAAISGGRLLIGGKPVDLQGLLSWDTGVKAADRFGKRIVLTDGSALAGDIRGLKDGKLILDHSVLGEQQIPLGIAAQAIFNPGPSVQANPGTLIHANGNKIPGTITWIRKDNISIKCGLGQLPLPRGRVRAFVFAIPKPVAASETVVLTDGSRLQGSLAFAKDEFVLTHATLGQLKLKMTDVARVTRRVAGVTPLARLQADVRERAGPVQPPLPLRVDDERGTILRIFPRTVVRYALPKAAAPRRLRGVLAPVPNARPPMKVDVRVGNAVKTYTVQPGADGIAVDLDLGTATSFELVVDTASPVSYPCGIEWRKAFIMEVVK